MVKNGILKRINAGGYPLITRASLSTPAYRVPSLDAGVLGLAHVCRCCGSAPSYIVDFACASAGFSRNFAET